MPKPPKTPSTTSLLTEVPQVAPSAETAPNANLMNMKEVLSEVYSKADVEVKTDINNAQIIALSKGEIFAQRYQCTIMRDLCQTIMTLSISKDRKSRKESTEIVKSMNTMPQLTEEPPTIRRRLLGD